MKPLQIRHPDASIKFKALTPLEMNSLHFSEKSTVLTPELLEQMAKKSASATAK